MKEQDYNKKCPCCPGYNTTSRYGALNNHIRRLAGTELIKRLFIPTFPSPHADWLKLNGKVKSGEDIIINA